MPEPAQKDVDAAAAILRDACGDRVRRDFPLAPLTTFRLGGPAAVYLEPDSIEDLKAVSEAVQATGIHVEIIGKGSNILVSDHGVDGLVLRLGRGFRWAARDGGALTAGGAMPVPALAGIALQHGLAGLEFGVAIPASLGGAVKMNAGAHGHALGDALQDVHLYRIGSADTETISADAAGFSYRRSVLPADAIVVGAVAALTEGDPGEIRAHMDEAREWRRRTQPLAEPNCGSVFKNPDDGGAAARLVEEAGGKQIKAGAAAVSAKHANFIIAHPGSMAADVIEVIRQIQDAVEARTGTLLEPEVRLVGRFDVTPR